MYWLKACPRCSGDLHEERDFYGAYVDCIQCGYVLANQEEQRLRAKGRTEVEQASPARRAA